MLKNILVVWFVVLLAACSSSSDNSGGDPDPNPNPNPNPGATTGVWLGPSNFGSTVLVIDNDEDFYGFSGDGAGAYQSIFGDASGAAEVFAHRDSDDPALGDSFTIVGDPLPAATYSFATANDGQSLNNTGGPGNFSLTLADSNDMPALSLADVQGTWRSTTGLGVPPASNPLVLQMTFTANGGISGFTQFAGGDELTLTGTASSAGQYLTISFTWTEKTYSGVAYIDPTTSRLIINTIGFNSDPGVEANQSFSSNMTRN